MELKEMIGMRIKELRTRKKLTQDHLAERMNASPKYLSRIERGKENPTLNTLINLAESLEVEIGSIFSFVQIEDPAKRKSLVNSLLDEADSDQLKLIYKVVTAMIR